MLMCPELLLDVAAEDLAEQLLRKAFVLGVSVCVFVFKLFVCFLSYLFIQLLEYLLILISYLFGYLVS